LVYTVWHDSPWPDTLATWRAQGLWRERPQLEGISSEKIRVNGKTCWQFSSSDHLALANHPQIHAAVQQALSDYGYGNPGSPFVCGYQTPLANCEAAFAEYTQRDCCLLFTSGYTANIGVLQALANKHSIIFADKHCHASLIDGARLAQARLIRYRHQDFDHLKYLLDKYPCQHRLIVSESIFSMQGDITNIVALSELAQRHNCLLIIDEAHSLGVSGPKGAGEILAQGLDQSSVPILISPLSKAFSTQGCAIVCGDKRWLQVIEQFARPLRYSTAPPAYLAQTLLSILELVKNADNDRQQLIELSRAWAKLIASHNDQFATIGSPIQTWRIGDPQRALATVEACWQLGYYLQAMRPPSVPQGQSLLRITLNCRHTAHMLHHLVKGLSQCCSTQETSQ